MSVILFLNVCGVLLNVVKWFTLNLVLYLCVPFLVFLMTLFSCCFPIDSLGAVVLVYPLLFFQITFYGKFSLLAVKCWILIGWKIIGFLLGSLVGVHLGMPLQYSPSDVLHWWMDLIKVSFSFGFLPGSFLRVSFCLPPDWHPRSYYWGFSFLNISDRVFNASLFPCTNFNKGLAGSRFYSA